MRIETKDERERRLLSVMAEHGDAVLHSCYLLCGELELARAYARAVFVCAYEENVLFQQRRGVLDDLLQIVLRVCPCRLCAGGKKARDWVTVGFLAMTPGVRRAALLCLYHGLSIGEAGQLLGISEERVLRAVRKAKEILWRKKCTGNVKSGAL